MTPRDWGGVGGKEEAVRMGEGGTKGERLARALGAARELMCCYGRLEGELRVVQVGKRLRRSGGVIRGCGRRDVAPRTTFRGEIVERSQGF